MTDRTARRARRRADPTARNRPGPGRQAAPPGTVSRDLAVDVLAAILHEGATLDDAFATADGRSDVATLDSRDRALARLIVTVVLRRLPQIDAVLASFLKTPIDSRGGRVREILIASAAQILFLDTPAHAVVNIAVAQAAADRKGRALKGLVNAVLRRIAAEGPAIAERQDAPGLVLPEWMLDRWASIYGPAATRAMAGLLLDEPPLDLTPKAADEADLWAIRLGGTVLPSGSIRLTKPGRIPELAGFTDGAWWVQDAAAALPARLIGAALGMTVLDLCAAPGGKTAQLAATGAQVIAVDRNERRMARLRDNLDRLGLAADCVVADAATWRPEAPADAVLLDAPCSATGVMRRRPDILRTRSREQIAQLAALQTRLLNAAVDMVRPGGTIVYCTCSLEPEEGEDQIDRLLNGSRQLARVPIDVDLLSGFEDCRTERGDLRILPTALGSRGGNDGFFVATLNKS